MMMLVVKARCELAPTLMLMRMWPSSSPYAFKKENIGYIWYLFPRSAFSLLRLPDKGVSLDISLAVLEAVRVCLRR